MSKGHAATMARAKGFIAALHENFTENIDRELRTLRCQHAELQRIVKKRCAQIERLFGVINELEQDLMLQRQTIDYCQATATLPEHKTIDGKEYKLREWELESQQSHEEDLLNRVLKPLHEEFRPFVKGQCRVLPLDTRFDIAEQNTRRFSDGVDESLKPFDFTRKQFDFYGGYLRLNENQKFKFAETKLCKAYK